MIYVSNDHGMMRVDLSGDLNRDNILSVRQDILEGLQPGTRKIDFHFGEVGQIDAPAMAMMVIVMKYLRGQEISSRVTGLTGECKYLATVLGLHYVAEVKGKNYTERDSV